MGPQLPHLSSKKLDKTLRTCLALKKKPEISALSLLHSDIILDIKYFTLYNNLTCDFKIR